MVLGAAVAMGASPAPTTAPGASAAPGATSVPGTNGADKDGDRGFGMRGFGMRGGDVGGGFHDITIASINGSSLSLKTADGWTRSITPTSTTTITKAGAKITVSDLKAGDQIAFSQTKQTDGTYTIDAIRVILPSVGGQVSAVSGSTITVTQGDGTSATIHVDSATTYQVEGLTTATLSDIKVGNFVVAQGTLRTDGSLDASLVASGFRGGPGMGGHGHGMGPATGTTARPPAPPPPRRPRRADLRSAHQFHDGRGAAALGPAPRSCVRGGRPEPAPPVMHRRIIMMML